MNKDVISIIGEYATLVETCKVFECFHPEQNILTFAEHLIKQNAKNIPIVIKNILGEDYENFVRFCSERKAVLSGSFIFQHLTNHNGEISHDLKIYTQHEEKNLRNYFPNWSFYGYYGDSAIFLHVKSFSLRFLPIENNIVAFGPEPFDNLLQNTFTFPNKFTFTSLQHLIESRKPCLESSHSGKIK